MFHYAFMVNAYAAASVVALLAGSVGWFLVLRGETFAGHALAHVGFTGATGAVLLGVPPLWGLLSVTLGGGVAMGLFGRRLGERDVAIGMVLSLALGLGLLFLHFYTAYAAQATALLFGNVLAVDAATVWQLAAIAMLSLAFLGVLSRRLIFASLNPELAEAQGVSLRGLAVGFLAITALATAACAQIVGVLLVFTLMVGPAASAQRLSTRILPGLLLAPLLALLQAWAGLAAAYYTDWPTSFWIAAASGTTYLGATTLARWRRP
jgi:zinc/manganese transport system permease protein